MRGHSLSLGSVDTFAWACCVVARAAMTRLLIMITDRPALERDVLANETGALVWWWSSHFLCVPPQKRPGQWRLAAPAVRIKGFDQRVINPLRQLLEQCRCSADGCWMSHMPCLACCRSWALAKLGSSPMRKSVS